MTSQQSDITTRSLGIIAQRVLCHWRALPPSVRAVYDPEDMISEVTLHVFTVASKYKPGLAKATTWVWWVADNRCKTILAHYKTKKVGADILVPMPEKFMVVGPERERHLVESRNAVERTIQHVSESARNLLGDLLGDGLQDKPNKKVVNELRKAARKQHATLDDFMLAYRGMVA